MSLGVEMDCREHVEEVPCDRNPSCTITTKYDVPYVAHRTTRGNRSKEWLPVTNRKEWKVLEVTHSVCSGG
jgi:hypothetical protein